MPTRDMPAAISTFLDTTNHGDIEGFVATFTADAYLNDWGREYLGHTGVRDWNRTDNIGAQAHLELLGLEPGYEPDTYVATLRVTGNGYNGTGSMTFHLRGGRIAGLHVG